MEKIVEELLAGKKGVASRFYRELSPSVRRYLRGRLPEEVDVEEILQDTFVAAFDSLPLYRGEAKLISWVLSIARHEVADFYRKRYVRKVVEKTSTLLDDVAEEIRTPEFEWEKKKLEKRFHTAYKALSKQYQLVLSLRYELGMSVKEVAREMKMSFKATESLLFRARSAFAAAYEQNLGE